MLAADPTVTDWMQGWGSIAGVVMAALAALFTGLLLRHEARVRREEKLDAEMAQARLVVAEVREGDASTITQPAGSSTPLFGLTNYSASPIFEVTVQVETRAGVLQNSFARSMVGPGESVFEGFHPHGVRISGFMAVAAFTDAQGLAWERVGTSHGSFIRRRGMSLGQTLAFITFIERGRPEARGRQPKDGGRRKPRRPLDPPS